MAAVIRLIGLAYKIYKSGNAESVGPALVHLGGRSGGASRSRYVDKINAVSNDK